MVMEKFLPSLYVHGMQISNLLLNYNFAAVEIILRDITQKIYQDFRN